MSWLLNFSIGPVQDFISAARRTRDLWMGSYILSEVSKAAADAIKKSGGKLIVPNNDADLNPGSNYNGANIILAHIPNGKDPKEIAEAAQEAGEKRFLEFASDAYLKVSGILNKGRWDKQKDASYLEFYYAWCPLDNNYKESRKRVARALAARKNLRDFEQWDGEAGVPKSSLDGARESVLSKEALKDGFVYDGVSIKSGESLDMMGVIKRAAEGVKRYQSVSQICALPWILGIEKLLESDGGKFGPIVGKVKEHCSDLVNLKALTRRDGDDLRHYGGTAFFINRYHDFTDGIGQDRKAAIEGVCKQLGAAVQNLQRESKLGEPNPYVAFLMADGDRIGKALSSIACEMRHRKFSRTLAEFASKAKDVVEKDHHGTCVYAGGDDVMAILPLHTALGCAAELKKAFECVMNKMRDDLKEEIPTLSVGISIAHFMEDMEDHRVFAKDAEKAAKDGIGGDGENIKEEDKRNALAVAVRTRGNDRVVCRGQWGDGDENSPLGTFYGRLQWLVEQFTARQIPSRFSYELRRAANIYKEWGENPGCAMKSDVIAVMKRKEMRREVCELLEKHIAAANWDSYRSIIRMADEMTVAQQIAASVRQAGGMGNADNHNAD